jgi:hypothetical protein
VARRKNGKTLAFCAQHVRRLNKEGVTLRTMESINKELDAPAENAALREKRDREEAFIKSLKA